jgi:hypothetical protein
MAPIVPPQGRTLFWISRTLRQISHKTPVFNEQDKTWKVGAGVKLETLIDALKKKEPLFPMVNVHGSDVAVTFTLVAIRHSFQDPLGSLWITLPSLPSFCAPSSKTNFNDSSEDCEETCPEQSFRMNDDLWFAVMGGSPGSFGVVTDMTIKPRWDEDHKAARALTIAASYDQGWIQESH